MATDPTNDAGQQRDERADDEAHEEYEDRLLRANLKEGFDLFRGDDRHGFRANGLEYMDDRRRRQRAEDLIFAEVMAGAQQARRFIEQLFQQSLKRDDEEYSERRRQTNLASSQQWRDQARDSGEAAFEPKQSS